MMEIRGFNELASLAIRHALHDDKDALARMEEMLLGSDGDDGQDAIDELGELAKLCIHAACNIGVVRLGAIIRRRKAEQSTSSETLPADPLKGVEHPQLGS